MKQNGLHTYSTILSYVNVGVTTLKQNRITNHSSLFLRMRFFSPNKSSGVHYQNSHRFRGGFKFVVCFFFQNSAMLKANYKRKTLKWNSDLQDNQTLF